MRKPAWIRLFALGGFRGCVYVITLSTRRQAQPSLPAHSLERDSGYDAGRRGCEHERGEG